MQQSPARRLTLRFFHLHFCCTLRERGREHSVGRSVGTASAAAGFFIDNYNARASRFSISRKPIPRAIAIERNSGRAMKGGGRPRGERLSFANGLKEIKIFRRWIVYICMGLAILEARARVGFTAGLRTRSHARNNSRERRISHSLLWRPQGNFESIAKFIGFSPFTGRAYARDSLDAGRPRPVIIYYRERQTDLTTY